MRLHRSTRARRACGGYLPLLNLLFCLGAAGCAEILGVTEGKPRPGEGGGGAGGATSQGGGAGSTSLDGPRLLFADLPSGPAGTYLTLHGIRLVELGDDLDDLQVMFGSTPAEIFGAPVDGSFAPAAEVARELDAVVVVVPPTLGAGAVDVQVIRRGVASEPIPFTVRPGTLRYVDAGAGNDQSPDCSFEAPCRSLDKLSSVLVRGDIAYVRAGEYVAPAECGTLPGGGAVTCALRLVALPEPGTALLPVAVVGYPHERPVIGRLGSPADMALYHVGFRALDAGHVILSNLVFSEVGIGGRVSTESLRVVGCRFAAFELEGLSLDEGADQVTVLGTSFARAGQDPTYLAQRGLHACASKAAGIEVGWSQFDDVGSPVLFDPTDSDIRFYGNHLYRPFALLDLAAPSDICAPFLARPTGQAAFFDNVVDDADFAFILPHADTAGAEIFFFNNTFQDLKAGGFRREHPDIAPIPGGEAIFVRNNVVVTKGAPYQCFHDLGVITAADDVGLLGSHNLFWGGTGALPGGLGEEVNPLLTGAAHTLGAGSPAIDAGIEVLGGSATSLPPFVLLDHGGLPRVMGAAIDIGAHEALPE